MKRVIVPFIVEHEDDMTLTGVCDAIEATVNRGEGAFIRRDTDKPRDPRPRIHQDAEGYFSPTVTSPPNTTPHA